MQNEFTDFGKPEEMQTAIALRDSASKLCQGFLTPLVIRDRGQFNGAAQSLRTIKDYRQQLEDIRTSVTKPLNMALRNVNDWFRAPADALIRAERTLKYAMAAFERFEHGRTDEERAPVRAAGIGFGTSWTYKVTDESSIPREYLMVDHDKIRKIVQTMKEKTQIPGIKVESIRTVSVRDTK